MIYALIGLGPNDVAITSLLWATEEKALADCLEIFKDYRSSVTIEADGVTHGQVIREWDVYRPYDNDDPWSDQFPARTLPVDRLFVSYYGGCGECSSLRLTQIEPGVPFVHWNLD